MSPSKLFVGDHTVLSPPESHELLPEEFLVNSRTCTSGLASLLHKAKTKNTSGSAALPTSCLGEHRGDMLNKHPKKKTQV